MAATVPSMVVASESMAPVLLSIWPTVDWMAPTLERIWSACLLSGSAADLIPAADLSTVVRTPMVSVWSLMFPTDWVIGVTLASMRLARTRVSMSIPAAVAVTASPAAIGISQ